MIEAVVMGAALVALGWVLLWSMIQEKVKPGEPAKGFFAMKHDQALSEKEESSTGEKDKNDSAAAADASRQLLKRGRYQARRGRYQLQRGQGQK